MLNNSLRDPKNRFLDHHYNQVKTRIEQEILITKKSLKLIIILILF